jgi:hypothetical protein
VFLFTYNIDDWKKGVRFWAGPHGGYMSRMRAIEHVFLYGEIRALILGKHNFLVVITCYDHLTRC